MTFKSLILFIQSPNEDPYINIITHCVEDLKIEKIIFQVLFLVLFVITILSTWILSGNPISSQVVTFVSLFATIMIAMSSLINTGLNVKKEVK